MNRLSNALTRIEERLSNLIASAETDYNNKSQKNYNLIKVDHYIVIFKKRLFSMYHDRLLVEYYLFIEL